jgi:hypothetical protein
MIGHEQPRLPAGNGQFELSPNHILHLALLTKKMLGNRLAERAHNLG